MNTAITPTTSVSEDTASCIMTALVIEPDLTREWLVAGCRSYLRRHSAAEYAHFLTPVERPEAAR